MREGLDGLEASNLLWMESDTLLEQALKHPPGEAFDDAETMRHTRREFSDSFQGMLITLPDVVSPNALQRQIDHLQGSSLCQINGGFS